MPAALMYTGLGFFGTMFAPFLASKIMVPFLLSPRRPYANVLGIIRDPWAPPSAGVRGVTSVVLMTGVIVVMVVMLAVTVLVSVVLWKIVAPRVASALAERLREDEDTKKWIASLQAQVPGEQNKQPQ
ncbi:hypothetical protein CVIRNUC_004408 [Coccomyxa viridis]|uniref:Uncharacterized protein n=1 Tax=Coccomyxa viridis TaxID=1274662 RepID=A0AAV1I1Q7_9CHLO|nr:hypothetical protein CVIRNUC_004408 [Coccomyxa viridis]